MESFSKVHLEKTLEWFRLAFLYGDSTDALADMLSSYFPTKRAFDASLEGLRTLGKTALNDEEKYILVQSEAFKGKRHQTIEEKEIIKTRKLIFKKIDRAIARLRNELFPEPTNLTTVLSPEVFNFFVF
jgi:hypothetical protein